MSHCWVLGHWILQDGREEKKRRFLSGLFSGPGGKDYQSFPTAQVRWRKKERKRKKATLICDAERTHPVTQPLEPGHQVPKPHETTFCFTSWWPTFLVSVEFSSVPVPPQTSTPWEISLCPQPHIRHWRATTGHLVKVQSVLEGFLPPLLPHSQTSQGCCYVLSKGLVCLTGISLHFPAFLPAFSMPLPSIWRRPLYPSRNLSLSSFPAFSLGWTFSWTWWRPVRKSWLFGWCHSGL